MRGFGKHAGQGELADAARTGEEQGMGNALRAQGSAKGGHDAVVAKKLREDHALPAALCRIASHGRPQEMLHGGRDFPRNFFHRTHRATDGIETFDGYPWYVAGTMIVHSGCVL